MAKLTSKNINIWIKHNLTAKEIAEKLNTTEKELPTILSDTFSKKFAESILRNLAKNDKVQHSVAPDVPVSTEMLCEVSEVPVSGELPEEKVAVVASTPVLIPLEDFQKERETLSIALAKSESEKNNLISEKRICQNELDIVQKKYEALLQEVKQQQLKLNDIIANLDETDKLIEEKKEEIIRLKDDLDFLDKEIRKLTEFKILCSSGHEVSEYKFFIGETDFSILEKMQKISEFLSSEFIANLEEQSLNQLLELARIVLSVQQIEKEKKVLYINSSPIAELLRLLGYEVVILS